MNLKDIKNHVNSFLNKGTEYYQLTEDQQRVRLINLLNTAVLFIIIPLVFIYNYLEKHDEALLVLVLIFPVIISCFFLNRNGKAQLANFLAMFSGMIAAHCVIFTSQSQTSIPIVFIVVAMSAIHLVKNRILKNALISTALVSYLISDYYNSKYLPFSGNDYFLTILFLLIFYMSIQYLSNQKKKYQAEIEENNVTIREQSETLIKVQNTLHQTELTQKQKNLDTVLASQAMQVKLKENMVEQLADVLNSKNPSKEIRRVMVDIKGQAETQKKMSLLGENIEEINAVLYERLFVDHPTLTKSEREMCSYLRLGLSNKEIASLKNITTNSVHVLKSRLRKKMNLKSNQELGPFLSNY